MRVVPRLDTISQTRRHQHPRWHRLVESSESSDLEPGHLSKLGTPVPASTRSALLTSNLVVGGSFSSTFRLVVGARRTRFWGGYQGVPGGSS